MRSAELLVDAFGRLPALVHEAVDGLAEDQLTARLDAQANPVAWLVWHLARVEDDHVAQAFDTEERWVAEGWADRFALPAVVDGVGYGHTPEQVAAVRAPAELLTGYYDAVSAATAEHLRALPDHGLDRVVDASWDPPVTLGVRLVSVLGDVLQHVGQAAYLRGLLERSEAPRGG